MTIRNFLSFLSDRERELQVIKNGGPEVSTPLFFIRWCSDRRRILWNNPLLHRVCWKIFSCCVTQVSPIFFFPYFSDHRKRRKDRIISAFSNLKSTWSHVALLLSSTDFLFLPSFIHSSSSFLSFSIFFSIFFFYFQLFFIIIIRKCVASCNHKQNVHNTPLQESLFNEKGLDYLSILVKSCVWRPTESPPPPPPSQCGHLNAGICSFSLEFSFLIFSPSSFQFLKRHFFFLHRFCQAFYYIACCR